MIYMAIIFGLIIYVLFGIIVNVVYLEERPYYSSWNKTDKDKEEFEKELAFWQNMLVARLILWPFVVLAYIWWLASWPFNNQRWTSHVRPIMINMLGIFKGRVE